MGLLPDWRIKKAEKYKAEKAKLESIAAGRLLDIAIADYLGISERDIDWSGYEGGFCYCGKTTESKASDNRLSGSKASDDRTLDSKVSDDKTSGNKVSDDRVSVGKASDDKASDSKASDDKGLVYFSISHSGEYVAVAVSEEPVGIDVEHKDDKRFLISKRMFDQNDMDYIAPEGFEALETDSDTEEAQCRFRDVWTIKESYVKCIGKGLTIPLKSFTADYGKISSGEPAAILGGDNDSYHVATKRLMGDKGSYSLTLCVEKRNPVMNIIWVEILA